MIAVIIISCFINQDIIWAQGEVPVWSKGPTTNTAYKAPADPVNPISIPKDLAVTTETFKAPLRATNGEGQKTIINIQDAHSSLSAQESITSILDTLVTKYDLRLVAIEGTAGYIDTSVLRTMPDNKMKKDLARSLMAEGRMSAGEFFSITSDKKIALYGIEDKALYDQNAEEFRKVYELGQSLKAGFAGLMSQLEALKSKAYSDELKTIARNALLHDEGKMAFSERWKYLSSLGKARGADLSGYPNLAKLGRSFELEKSINFEKANKERDLLIDILSKKVSKRDLEELVLKSLSFKTGKIAQAEFYGFLQELAGNSSVDPAPYADLITFTKYITLYESIDLLKIMEEAGEFEDAVENKLFTSDDQKRLHDLAVHFSLVRDLFGIKLTHNGLTELETLLKTHDAASAAAFIREISARYNVPIEGGYDIGAIYANIPDALSFYKTAEARNEAMLSNTIKRMNEEGRSIAALVTGGYHTRGISDILRQKQTSYIVMLPRFDASKPERPYVAILTKKKAPYGELLKAGTHYLATGAYNNPSLMDEELFGVWKADLIPSLKKRIKDAGSEREAYEDITRYFNEWKEEKRKDYAGSANEISPEKFELFLNKVLLPELFPEKPEAGAPASGKALDKKAELIERLASDPEIMKDPHEFYVKFPLMCRRLGIDPQEAEAMKTEVRLEVVKRLKEALAAKAVKPEPPVRSAVKPQDDIERKRSARQALSNAIKTPEVVFEGDSVVAVKDAGNLLVVGDIHADPDALYEHLKTAGRASKDAKGRILFKIERGDVIVFTGDYIDRGPKSVEAVELVMAIRDAAEKAGGRAILLEGNHDYYMFLFLKRMAERLGRGENVSLNDAVAEAYKIGYDFSGSPATAYDFGKTVEQFCRRYHPGAAEEVDKRSIDFGVAFEKMKEAGIVDFFTKKLKRLAVVDNNVISHAYIPLMYSIKFGSDRLFIDSGEMAGSNFDLKRMDALISEAFSGYLDANRSKLPTKMFTMLAWPYVHDEGLLNDILLRAGRNKLYDSLREQMGLAEGLPFRIIVGHDPNIYTIWRGTVEGLNDDIIVADGGMSAGYRVKVRDLEKKEGRTVEYRGGVIEFDALGGTMVHRLYRDEDDSVIEDEVDAAVLYRGETAEAVLPGENAGILREIEALSAEIEKVQAAAVRKIIAHLIEKTAVAIKGSTRTLTVRQVIGRMKWYAERLASDKEAERSAAELADLVMGLDKTLFNDAACEKFFRLVEEMSAGVLNSEEATVLLDVLKDRVGNSLSGAMNAELVVGIPEDDPERNRMIGLCKNSIAVLEERLGGLLGLERFTECKKGDIKDLRFENKALEVPIEPLAPAGEAESSGSKPSSSIKRSLINGLGGLIIAFMIFFGGARQASADNGAGLPLANASATSVQNHKMKTIREEIRISAEIIRLLYPGISDDEFRTRVAANFWTKYHERDRFRTVRQYGGGPAVGPGIEVGRIVRSRTGKLYYRPATAEDIIRFIKSQPSEERARLVTALNAALGGRWNEIAVLKGEALGQRLSREILSNKRFAEILLTFRLQMYAVRMELPEAEPLLNADGSINMHILELLARFWQENYQRKRDLVVAKARRDSFIANVTSAPKEPFRLLQALEARPRQTAPAPAPAPKATAAAPQPAAPKTTKPVPAPRVAAAAPQPAAPQAAVQATEIAPKAATEAPAEQPESSLMKAGATWLPIALILALLNFIYILFRARKTLEYFARYGKPGDVFEMDLEKGLLDDREVMNLLLLSKNEISVWRVPNRLYYIFRVESSETYPTDDPLEDIYYFEGRVRPTPKGSNIIHSEPLDSDFNEAGANRRYIISKAGVTQFKFAPHVEREFTPFPPKSPIALFQAFIDRIKAADFFHEEKFVVDGKEYEKNENGVSSIRAHLRDTHRLDWVVLENMYMVKELSLAIDENLKKKTEDYGIDIQKLIREAMFESIKIRGPNAFKKISKDFITIALIDKSRSLFEGPSLSGDDAPNNFAFINKAVLEKIAESLPENNRQAALEILLAVGITHELRHEAGEKREELITAEDVALTLHLCKMKHVNPEVLIKALESVAEGRGFLEALKPAAKEAAAQKTARKVPEKAAPAAVEKSAKETTQKAAQAPAAGRDILSMSSKERLAIGASNVSMHEERVALIADLIAKKLEIGTKIELSFGLRRFLRAAAEVHDGKYEEPDARDEKDDHGEKVVADIKSLGIKMPPEVELLIRYHQHPSKFFKTSASTPENLFKDISLLLSIIYIAAAFDKSQSAGEDFGTALSSIKAKCKEEKITDKGPLEALTKMVRKILTKEKEFEDLLGAVAKARGTASLKHPDLVFITTGNRIASPMGGDMKADKRGRGLGALLLAGGIVLLTAGKASAAETVSKAAYQATGSFIGANTIISLIVFLGVALLACYFAASVLKKFYGRSRKGLAYLTGLGILIFQFVFFNIAEARIANSLEDAGRTTVANIKQLGNALMMKEEPIAAVGEGVDHALISIKGIPGEVVRVDARARISLVRYSDLERYEPATGYRIYGIFNTAPQAENGKHTTLVASEGRELRGRNKESKRAGGAFFVRYTNGAVRMVRNTDENYAKFLKNQRQNVAVAVQAGPLIKESGIIQDKLPSESTSRLYVGVDPATGRIKFMHVGTNVTGYSRVAEILEAHFTEYPDVMLFDAGQADKTQMSREGFSTLPSLEGEDIYIMVLEARPLPTLPSPGMILPLKKLVAPRMDFKKYAVRVAPWLEEGIFLALPMAISHFVFGLDSFWTPIFVAASRVIFYFLHEGARSKAPPSQFVVPLTVALFGIAMSFLPVFSQIVFTSPVYAITAYTFLSFIFHLGANIIAIAAGRTPATIGGAPQEEKADAAPVEAMDAEALIKYTAEATPKQLVDYLMASGRDLQASLILEVLSSNKEKLDEFRRLLIDAKMAEDRVIDSIVGALDKNRDVLSHTSAAKMAELVRTAGASSWESLLLKVYKKLNKQLAGAEEGNIGRIALNAKAILDYRAERRESEEAVRAKKPASSAPAATAEPARAVIAAPKAAAAMPQGKEISADEARAILESNDFGRVNTGAIVFKPDLPEETRLAVIKKLQAMSIDTNRFARLVGPVNMYIVLQLWSDGFERSLEEIGKAGIDISMGRTWLEKGKSDPAKAEAFQRWVRSIYRDMEKNPGLYKEDTVKAIRFLAYAIECLNGGAEVVVLRSTGKGLQAMVRESIVKDPKVNANFIHCAASEDTGKEKSIYLALAKEAAQNRVSMRGIAPEDNIPPRTPKGSVAECLNTIIDDERLLDLALTKGFDIKKDLLSKRLNKKKQPFSYRTVKSREVVVLIELGILVRTEKGKFKFSDYMIGPDSRGPPNRGYTINLVRALLSPKPMHSGEIPRELRPGLREDIIAFADDYRAKGIGVPAVRTDVSLLTKDDIYLFREGNHFRIYDKMGSHVMVVGGVRGTLFSVWAPNASSVSVIGDFNGWNKESHKLKQRDDSSGIWEGFIGGVAEGALYKYHIVSRINNHRADKGDPYGFYWQVPSKSTTASIVWDLGYKWNDEEWMKTRAKANALNAPISVYEVHPGSWQRVPEENNRPLTYREMASKLVDYVKKMGFTHVELMPVMEHPFYGSWGYQTTGYFAPTSRYGTPQDFMYLIDELHRNGIGVILDWVPAQFPSDAHGPAFFDGTHLYEHADPRQRVHPDWKSDIFNYGRKETRDFLISSALFWLDKYHVDGLRVDAVASMLYLDYSRKAGEWVPNRHGGRENLDAIEFLKKLNEAVYRFFPDVQTFAEESTAWTGVSRPTYTGGLGFGMKWNMGWMHDILEYISKDPVFRKYSHDSLTFSMIYAFTENFILALSHDEVVHGKNSLLNKMPGDEWQKFANLRLLMGYMYAHPGKKLLFMGMEFGQGNEWNHDTSLDWHLLQYPLHSGMQKWMQDLNALYRSEPGLYEKDFTHDGFEWVDFHDWGNSVISFIRKGKDPEDTVLAVCNFTPVPRHNYKIKAPAAGFWKEMLNSDAKEYGGSGMGNSGRVEAGQDGTVSLTLPPLGILIFKQERSSKTPPEAAPQRISVVGQVLAALGTAASTAVYSYFVNDGAWLYIGAGVGPAIMSFYLLTGLALRIFPYLVKHGIMKKRPLIRFLRELGIDDTRVSSEKVEFAEVRGGLLYINIENLRSLPQWLQFLVGLHERAHLLGWNEIVATLFPFVGALHKTPALRKAATEKETSREYEPAKPKAAAAKAQLAPAQVLSRVPSKKPAPEARIIIGVSKNASPETEKAVRNAMSKDVTVLRVENEAFLHNIMSEQGYDGVFIDETVKAEDLNNGMLKNTVEAIKNGRFMLAQPQLVTLDKSMLSSKTRKELLEILGFIMIYQRELERGDIDKDLTSALEKLGHGRINTPAELTELVLQKLAKRKSEVAFMYNQGFEKTLAQAVQASGKDGKAIAMATTENVAVDDEYIADNMQAAIKKGIPNCFIYGNKFNTVEKAQAFLRASGYKGDLDQIVFVDKRGKTYEELAESIRQQINAKTGLEVLASNIGIRAIKGEVLKNGEVPATAKLLEITEKRIGGKDIPLVMNTYQVMLRILTELPEGVSVENAIADLARILPGLSYDKAKGIFAYLPRIDFNEYKSEIEAYRRSVEFVMTAA